MRRHEWLFPAGSVFLRPCSARGGIVRYYAARPLAQQVLTEYNLIAVVLCGHATDSTGQCEKFPAREFFLSSATLRRQGNEAAQHEVDSEASPPRLPAAARLPGGRPAARCRRSAPPADGSDRLRELNRLVAEHHAALYRYAYRLSGSVHDAEDLTQQVFLVAGEKLNQLREPLSVRNWLFTVLRNGYLKNLRQRIPTPVASLELNLDQLADDREDEGPIDGEQLQTALAQLPPEFRVVLLMFYFEELNYREIAEALEIPLGTVMSRLSRAKQHLRNELNSRTAPWPLQT